MYLFGPVFHRSISEELVWFGWYTLKEFNDSKPQTAIFANHKTKKKRHKAALDYISEEITVFSLREDSFSDVFLSKSKFRSKKCIKLQKKDCNKKPWSAPYVVNYFVYLQNMRTSCCKPHIYLVKFNQMTIFSFCAFLIMLFFQDSETLKSTDKICRQLIYHLTPHSKWLRKSMTRRKAQAWWETFSVLYGIKTSEYADME